MENENEAVPYRVLGEIADLLFEECEEDESLLAEALDGLDVNIRDELLVSDFLNAYQTFYYFFREHPGDLEKDRLILQPASALIEGLILGEIEFLEVIFRIEDHQPVVSVSDGEETLVHYRGKEAYRQSIRFIDENL
ncbi:MAG TPA: hypothetical protein VMW63_01395 [Methanoregulaceae archaeon]|nr:hypothetical protein [Methanoregulaceae archaeon]